MGRGGAGQHPFHPLLIDKFQVISGDPQIQNKENFDANYVQPLILQVNQVLQVNLVMRQNRPTI